MKLLRTRLNQKQNECSKRRVESMTKSTWRILYNMKLEKEDTVFNTISSAIKKKTKLGR